MMDTRDLRIQLSTIGLRGMAALTLRNRLHRHLVALELCRPVVTGARGLEIGGPSELFSRSGILPLYPLLERLDNCDFAAATIWHGDAVDGSPFVYDADRGPGTRYVRDATALTGIEDGAYDVLLSSHTLEHIANPLRALDEWKRAVGEDGHLVLVVPHVQNSFDHRRPVTSLAHIEADYASATTEDDTTHVAEFMELCDLERVPERLTRAAFDERTGAQVENRTVHHHVFDTDLVVQVLDRAGCEIVTVEPALPFHIVAVARARPGDNAALLADSARWRRRSVFRRDRD